MVGLSVSIMTVLNITEVDDINSVEQLQAFVKYYTFLVL